jgi:hypothetical protein
MKLTLLTTVCVLASLCRSDVALSKDSPEIQKELAGWKPLLEMDSRKQGKRYGHLEA